MVYGCLWDGFKGLNGLAISGEWHRRHARTACASEMSCGSKAASGFRTGFALSHRNALIAELASPTYTFTSTGKMVVEAKADMKKRGMRSPDLADAFLLTSRVVRGGKCRHTADECGAVPGGPPRLKCAAA